MDTHKNAPLTPKGREMMVRAFVDRELSKAAAAASSTSLQRPLPNGSNASAPKGSTACVIAHLVLFIAEPNDACHSRGDRGFAAAALHRQADRGRGWRVGGDRQPHSAPPWPQPGLSPRAGAADPALRAREARRAHSYRYQAWTHRFGGPSDHGTTNRRRQPPPRHRLSSSTSASTMHPGSPSVRS